MTSKQAKLERRDNMKGNTSEKALNIFLWFIVISMLISLGMTTYTALTALTAKARGAAWFLDLEIVAGLIVVMLPKLLAVKFKVYLPPLLYGLFLMFIYGSIYLGTIYHFYSVPYWDKGLHLISGALLAGFALSTFGGLIPNEGIKHIPPFFISLYSTAFAVFCGVLWEFYEFTCDSFGMNLQRYMKNGHMLVGRAALMDTMSDLFADFIGALIFAVIAYAKLHRDSHWVEKFFFHRNV